MVLRFRVYGVGDFEIGLRFQGVTFIYLGGGGEPGSRFSGFRSLGWASAIFAVGLSKCICDLAPKPLSPKAPKP